DGAPQDEADHGEDRKMTHTNFTRRALMRSAAALGTAALLPQRLLAQQPARTAAPLPARGELLIRGATVLTIDPALPDLPARRVHVRDGAIVAVAQKIDAPSPHGIDTARLTCTAP